MTEDRGLHRSIPDPSLNLITRTRLLMAETRDLKMKPQLIIRFPVFP